VADSVFRMAETLTIRIPLSLPAEWCNNAVRSHVRPSRLVYRKYPISLISGRADTISRQRQIIAAILKGILSCPLKAFPQGKSRQAKTPQPRRRRLRRSPVSRPSSRTNPRPSR
jgi:hypothetical protein